MLLVLIFGISKYLFYTYNLILNYVKSYNYDTIGSQKRNKSDCIRANPTLKLRKIIFQKGQNDNTQFKIIKIN